jgi:hypothetical protein
MRTKCQNCFARELFRKKPQMKNHRVGMPGCERFCFKESLAPSDAAAVGDLWIAQHGEPRFQCP